MSASDLRDAFNAVSLPAGVRCTGAFLLYCDPAGTPHGKRSHQKLVFNCVRSADNTAHQFTTDALHPGTNVNAEAATFARKIIGEI